MKHDTQEPQRKFGFGLPASVAVHLLVAFLLIFGLPISLPKPEEEQSVEVDLVPPPEAKETAEAEPPPPPPPPQEEEAEEQQEPEPEPEETPPQPEPPPGNEAEQRAPQPVLQPVFRFGETDAGPREAPDGNAAQEGAPAEAEAQEQETEKPAAPKTLSAQGQEAQAAPAETPEQQAPEPAEPTEAAEAEAEAAVEDAGRLASQAATGDIIATTAINEVPRGVRAGRLCVTVLREELRNAVPPYFPDLLPSYRLDEGTTLDVRKGAFRMGGEWFNLSYRCEIDSDATRVLSFAFQVGNRVPPGEWQRRGLPVN